MRRGILVLFSMVVCFFVLLPQKEAYAAKTEVEEVLQVKDKAMMCSLLAQCMRRHQDKVTFWYPGIYEDICEYSEKDYEELLAELAWQDDYAVGNLAVITVKYKIEEGTTITFEMQYYTTLKQERHVNRKVRKLVRKRKKERPAVKVKWAHDYLIGHVTYDGNCITAYDALAKGRGNCMAYSLAYQRILQELEVPCICIRGKDHMWNMVQLGGMWYSVDVTWDDTGGGDFYFLKGTKDFKDHDKVQCGLFKKLKLAKKQYLFLQLRK